MRKALENNDNFNYKKKASLKEAKLIRWLVRIRGKTDVACD